MTQIKYAIDNNTATKNLLLRLMVFISAAVIATASLAAEVSWTGLAATQNWNAPDNWSNGVPQPNDDVFILVDNTQSIIINDDVVIASLQLTEATLQIQNSLTITQSFDWSGGTLSGSGKTLLNGTSSMLFLGPYFGMLVDNHELINNGTLYFKGGSFILESQTVLTNSASGVFEYSNDTNTHIHGEHLCIMCSVMFGEGLFVNNGIVQDITTADTTPILEIYTIFHNNNLVKLSSIRTYEEAGLALHGDGNHSGIFDIGEYNGEILSFLSGTHELGPSRNIHGGISQTPFFSDNATITFTEYRALFIGTSDNVLLDSGPLIISDITSSNNFNLSLSENAGLTSLAYSPEHDFIGSDTVSYWITNTNREIQAMINYSIIDFSLDQNSVSELVLNNALVATILPSAPAELSYQLATGSSPAFKLSTENSAQILVADSNLIDYETTNTHAISVTATNQIGQRLTYTFDIFVLPENEAPTVIELLGQQIPENATNQTVIGTLSANDPDQGDTHTFELLTQNTPFEIVGDALKVSNTNLLDFETIAQYALEIKATDTGKLFTQEIFTITVTDSNEAPSNLRLSNNSVSENAINDTTIGFFSSTDPDANDSDTHIYTLISSGTPFEIAANQLIVADSSRLDFESNDSYSLNVQVTDSGGMSLQKIFTINVINAASGNIQFELAEHTINENAESFDLLITREGGSDEAINASIDIAGTAIDEQDFTLSTTEISWEHGDSAAQTITLSIINDEIDEPDETILLLLTSEDATLGKPFSLTINIIDNDIAVFPNAGSFDASETISSPQIGLPYTQEIQVSGGIEPYAFTWLGSIPGLTLQGNMITGTPSSYGDFEFSVTISDNAEANPATKTLRYTLRVLPEDLIIIPAELTLGIKDVTYVHQFSAFGGIPPYQWHTVSGLPEGLTLRDTGMLTGKPRQTGDFLFATTVTDSRGTSVSAALTLTVFDQGLMSNTPELLPAGKVNIGYAVPILVSGGNNPYDCAITAGALPPGLILEQCKISGEPEIIGDYSFQLLVYDSNNPNIAIQKPHTIAIKATAAGLPSKITVARRTEIPDLSTSSPGESYLDEASTGMATDAFGNHYVIGHAYTNNYYAIQILKYMPDGILEWHQTFESATHNYVYSIAIAPDQSVYVAGYQLSDTTYQGLIVKYNSLGTLLWEKNYPQELANTFYKIAADSSGIYLVGEAYAQNNFDALILKLDHSGNQLWQQSYATSTNDTAYDLSLLPCAEEASSCELVTGGAVGNSLRTGWLHKRKTNNGQLVGDTINIPEGTVKAIDHTEDGDIIVGGDNSSNAGWHLQKYNNDLTQQWVSTYQEYSAGGMRDIVIDFDNIIYTVGYGFNDKDRDVLIISLDDDGKLISENLIDQTEDERGNSILIDANYRLMVSGQQTTDTSAKFLLLTIDYGKSIQ